MGGGEPSPPPKGVARYASPSRVRASHVPKVPVCVRERILAYYSCVLKAGLFSGKFPAAGHDTSPLFSRLLASQTSKP